ncbi:MAG: hypothetical protein KGN77_01900 [Xanthomonadaceae bacterium]|nr:hypothetical protein [Xanthomonadaceae bacterium]
MSARNWLPCIDFTLASEGGLTNDAGDPGGLTNFGISQRAYPDLDIARLNQNDAETIYRRDYWNKVAGDALPAGIDLMVFDMAVNAGIGRSAEIFQRCLGVDADGVIGPATLAAVQCAAPGPLITAIGAAQLAFYQALPGWVEFGRGWAARVARRVDAATGMLTATTGAST